MSTADDNPHYKVMQSDYVPGPGNLENLGGNTSSNVMGYHSQPLLRDLLRQINSITQAVIDASETKLQDYSLKVTPGTKLEQAQAIEWPSFLGEPKNYITYQQYKVLAKSQSRSAEYIRTNYEDYARGPFGTNAIDTINLSQTIQQESKNVGEFLDTYLGAVDDTSEFRTLELLQDWAQSGLQHAKNLAALFKEKLEKQIQVPSPEMDQIGEIDARSYQAFFQTKLNAANKEIKRITDDLKKEHQSNSEIFYKKFLGPALQFRLEVARPLESNIGLGTFLSQQAVQADSLTAVDFSNLLVDQMKRNENFDKRMSQVLNMVKVRDTFGGFIEQFNDKLEKPLATPFSKIDVPAEEIDAFKELGVALTEKIEASNPFKSAHAMLDGTDDDEAHPQYIRRGGDVITGDLELDEDVKVGGIVPSTHAHTGEDGSPKISGTNVDGLVTSSIDKTQTVSIPTKLRLINNQTYKGTNNVTLVNSRIAWDGDSALQFEVQSTIVGDGAQNNPTPTPAYKVKTLYTAPADTVAVATDVSFFTFADKTSVSTKRWSGAGTVTSVAGNTTFEDADGTGADARFSNIRDLTQDYHDGRVYIVDGDNNKIKMTGAGAINGLVIPTTITTVYTSNRPIKRIDSQGQNFLNTLYVLLGPDTDGKDLVVKLTDNDGNNNKAGTYTVTPITELSHKYSNVIDIAATSNGYVYLLSTVALIQFDPTSKTVQIFNIQDEVGTATPMCITSDQSNNIYIGFGGTGAFVKKFSFTRKIAELFAGSQSATGDTDGTSVSARFTNIKDIATLWDGTQRAVPSNGNRFYILDGSKVKLIHPANDVVNPL